MENPIYGYLLEIVRNEKVSDFHLHSNKPLAYRGDGEIKHKDNMFITDEDLQGFFRSELGDEGFEEFADYGDIDFAVQ